jgi:hypothetical protein
MLHKKAYLIGILKLHRKLQINGAGMDMHQPLAITDNLDTEPQETAEWIASSALCVGICRSSASTLFVIEIIDCCERSRIAMA